MDPPRWGLCARLADRDGRKGICVCSGRGDGTGAVHHACGQGRCRGELEADEGAAASPEGAGVDRARRAVVRGEPGRVRILTWRDTSAGLVNVLV